MYTRGHRFIFIDEMLRTWKREDWRGSRACFYADNGLIEHRDHRKLQTDIDKMINLFERVGLKIYDNSV